VTTPRASQETGPPLPRQRLAALLGAARDEYAAEALKGSAGRAVQARFAARIDELIREIVSLDRQETMLPVAVCALGGYGRRTLCLHSDVDLLVLFDGTIARSEERFVNVLLHPLWDLRLTVGHHVRELRDLDHLDVDNAEFLLALRDARLIVGDERLFGRLQQRMGEAGADISSQLLDSLLSLVRQRHARFNDTFYQLEPDIKNAPGGLRDLGAVRCIRAMAPPIPPGSDTVVVERLDEAEDFLLRIRSVLHLAAGRDVNLLTHELQERVADTLGYSGAAARQRVEAMMSEYFAHARLVSKAVESSRASVERAGDHRLPRRAGRHLETAADGLRFSDPARAAYQPGLWIEAFRVALANGCAVSEQARSCIQGNVEHYTADDFAATDAERRQIRSLMRPRHGLYARLSEMHDCGLLERIFPEFARIHSRVIRDFYHKYTVDEHTLLTIRGLELLSRPSTPSRERFTVILQEVHAPELLTLALLYHDVGKWRDHDHAAESVVMAQAMMDRLQVPLEERQVIDFLIRNHLQMSQVAFRRDSEDPEVVAEFAQLVGSEELLKMLCIMTLVDIEAVSPDTLTPWKEDLLWRLYVDTYNRLTLGYADELIQKDQAGLSVLIAGRPDDIGEEELTRFVNGLPRRYLALFGLGAIYRHVRLARDIHPDEVHAAIEQHGEIWELSVVTLDKPYLFASVSGVLSYFGMDIHRAQAMTTPDGLVLDVFEFTDDGGFLRQNPGATSEILGLLQAAVAGTADVKTMLRGRERSVVYRRPRRVSPVVYIDNDYSRMYTVVEIVADDRPGLLYRISRVISGHGCDVDLALISTEGRKAIDVLHVTRQGQKLSEGAQADLKRELEHVLEAVHETD
jgi:[protein-PII] uridylyltransferase